MLPKGTRNDDDRNGKNFLQYVLKPNGKGRRHVAVPDFTGIFQLGHDLHNNSTEFNSFLSTYKLCSPEANFEARENI